MSENQLLVLQLEASAAPVATPGPDTFSLCCSALPSLVPASRLASRPLLVRKPLAGPRSAVYAEAALVLAWLRPAAAHPSWSGLSGPAPPLV